LAYSIVAAILVRDRNLGGSSKLDPLVAEVEPNVASSRALSTFLRDIARPVSPGRARRR
jgi:hypothetical protein